MKASLGIACWYANDSLLGSSRNTSGKDAFPNSNRSDHFAEFMKALKAEHRV